MRLQHPFHETAGGAIRGGAFGGRPHFARAPLPLAVLLLACGLFAAVPAHAQGAPAPEPPASGPEAQLPPELRAPEEALSETAALEDAEGRYQAGDLKGAAAAYKQILAAFPDLADTGTVLYRLGDALVRLGRPEEGRLYWERLLASVPDSPYTTAVEDALLPIYRREGELDKALDILLARLGRAPVEEKAGLLAEVARVHLDLGEPEHAVRDLLRRQRYLPPEARNQGINELKKMIDTRLSERDLKELADRFPEAIPGAWILERLVRLYADQGEAYLTERWGERYLSSYAGRPFADEVRRLIREQHRGLREDRHRVGVLLHLSGDLAPYGERVLRGVRLAYRAQRALLPKGTLGLWVRDLDGSAPFLGTHLSALLREADPEVVIGPMLSAELTDAVRQADRAHVPLIAPLVARPPGLEGPVVGLGVSPRMEGVAAARYAAAQGLGRFVTVAPEGPYGRAVAAAFRAELERLGGEVQSTVFFGADEEDVRGIVQRVVDRDLKRDGLPAVTPEDIAAMDPDEIELAGLTADDEIRISAEPVQPLQGPPVGPHPYLPGFDAVFLPGPWERIAVVAPHLPFFDINVPVIGTSGWNDPRLIAAGGPAVVGGRFVTPFDRNGQAARAFVKAYRAAYGEAPDLFAALGYDAMRLAARAVLGEGAGGETVWDRMTGPFTGVTGTFEVTAAGRVDRTLDVLKVGRRRFSRAGQVPLGMDPAAPPALPGPALGNPGLPLPVSAR